MIHICPEMYFHIKILFIDYFIYNFIQTESSVFQQEVGGFMIQKIHHLRSQVSNPRQNGQPLFGTWFSNYKWFLEFPSVKNNLFKLIYIEFPYSTL